jgi:hypothetical protein
MLQLNNFSQPHSESLETNTSGIVGNFTTIKIESDLRGDMQSEPTVMLDS